MIEDAEREIIKVKNKPIRDVVELSKHFRGRRNCIVFLTESFRIDLDNRMSRLAELKENSISKNKIKNKMLELLKKLDEPNDDRWEKDDDVYYGEIKAQIQVLKEILGE